MKNIPTLDKTKAIRNSVPGKFSKIEFINYFLLTLIAIFFIIPITALSYHYYKFGMPARLQGVISFIFYYVKEMFNWL